MISSSPSQNAGTEKPTNAARLTSRSNTPPRAPRPTAPADGDRQRQDEAGAHEQERVAQPPPAPRPPAPRRGASSRNRHPPRAPSQPTQRSTSGRSRPRALSRAGIGRGQRRVRLQHEVDRIAPASGRSGHRREQGDGEQDEGASTRRRRISSSYPIFPPSFISSIWIPGSPAGAPLLAQQMSSSGDLSSPYKSVPHLFLVGHLITAYPQTAVIGCRDRDQRPSSIRPSRP